MIDAGRYEVHHGHNKLFCELDERRGSFRTGPIQISRAQVVLPAGDVDCSMDVSVTLLPGPLERHGLSIAAPLASRLMVNTLPVVPPAPAPMPSPNPTTPEQGWWGSVP